jgi:ligand-binding sensor domain-containing protein/two-component sensor histidine kinase
VKRKRLQAAALLLLSAWSVHAKRLPIKTYTTADGLARDEVRCITQDSHGFLWFCTAEGLSRFDGYGFTNYRTEQGLPGNVVTGFLETRAGAYWISTSAGVARFDPAGNGPSRFIRQTLKPDQPRIPQVLYQDAAGGVWCGTRTGIFPSGDGGAFYLAPGGTAFRRADLPMPDPTVSAILVDRRGTLWVGSQDRLYSRDANGVVRNYDDVPALAGQFIMRLLEDRQGRLWIGTRFGLIRMDSAAAPSHVRRYTIADGLPADRIQAMLETSDGTLWIGTTEGLAEWVAEPQPGRPEFQSYGTAEGLSGKAVTALAEDRDGNLWIGTDGSGAMKIARGGFVTYTESEGPDAASLILSGEGELFVMHNETHRQPKVGRFDGQNFVPVRPAWPSGTVSGWGLGQIALQDHAGEWWIGTGSGLCRFARTDRIDQLAGARPISVYSRKSGLLSDNIFGIYEDSHGDIWIGTIGPEMEDSLARWERRTNSIHVFTTAEGLTEKPAPTGFMEDRAGNLWISLYHERLARYRDGRFTVFRPEDGIPGFLNRMFLDSSGRLWIATSAALVRVDDPSQEHPSFTAYTVAQGLSSSYIAALTEDRWGRLYAATGRGVDRFEPQGSGLGRIRRYTTADGLAAGGLEQAIRDPQGNLWFSTSLGISQFVPAEDRPRVPPPVLVTGVTVAGVARPISDLGQSSVVGLRLPRNPLRIDFVGLGFSPGEMLRYQYMLEGADRQWSAPTDERAVVYAGLSAGSYRFLVRAVTSDGAVSTEPAIVSFTILPPVWRTWWFLTICGIALCLIIYCLHRYRLRQLLAVANVRTRIATDLHDDIGASLSQIAILSEVARGSANGKGGPLVEIAEISRELVDSMSDIVWAINPDHDHLSNLVYRMRRFATDVLGGQKIGLNFRSSVAENDLRIGADLRRHVYLMFKEAIHNVVRHSGATRVDVDLYRAQDALILRLADDGRGFDPAAHYEGRGLANFHKRAQELKGKLTLESLPGKGTALTLEVPLESVRNLSGLRGK